METLTHAFISISPFLPCRRFHRLQFTSSPLAIPTSTPSRPKSPSYLIMRSRRTYTRPPSRPPSRSTPNIQKWARRAEKLWTQSTPTERSLFATATLAVVAVAGLAINVLFHVSLALAFLAIPLLFAPILFTILASVSLFGLLTFATAGAGFFFVGTPLLATAMLAKALFPFAVIAGAAGFVASKVIGWGRDVGYEDGSQDIEEELYDSGKAEVDAMQQFDERLGYRPSPGRSRDIMGWGMSDVVDELDYSGLGEYRQLFIEERIDGRTLLTLTDDDIKAEFGSLMPLGDRVRLSKLVSELRRQSSRQ
eukprot:GFKZ01006801.1.p2 GENE.GFKZ01006801.1~~GFKZ01006801.1.p2  ORF type:complete len:308 (+),score=41.50 GFKZ01006801.1:387-1310(+)